MSGSRKARNHPKLIIWGASGHARVVADIVQLNARYELFGFLDDTVSAPDHFLGFTVFHNLESLRAAEVASAIVGVGDCRARLRLAERAIRGGYALVSAIHPRAVIAPGVAVADGSVVAAGAIVNPGSRVGANVIINTAATIDHDCTIQDGAHIGPGCHLGGRVTVGATAWLGIGAIVRDGVSIGNNAIVGAGSLVLKDVPEGTVAYGSPARLVRKVEDHQNQDLLACNPDDCLAKH